jgi:hypothetical protein
MSVYRAHADGYRLRMASQQDVRRIAPSLPETSDAAGHFGSAC